MLRCLKNKLKSFFCLHEWELDDKPYDFCVRFKCKKCGGEKVIRGFIK